MTYAANAVRFHAGTAAAVKRRQRKVAELAQLVDGSVVGYSPDEVVLPRDAVIRTIARAVRDQSFAKRVKRAYGYTCAACGLQFDVLDAAHILPVSYKANYSTRNGVCLCPNHHRAFDSDLFRVRPDFSIELNQPMVRTFERRHRAQGREMLLDSLYRNLRIPANPLEQPAPNLLTRRLSLGVGHA